MSSLQIFEFERQEMRTELINDEAWFVGKDVAEVLGYKDTSDALRKHVDEEDKLSRQIADSGQNRSMYLINESGLYSLILKSKMPNAKKFKRWVTSEVLPSIRRHGAFMTQERIEQALTDPDTIIKLATTLKQEREEKMLLEQQIAEYEPRISYLDTILSSTDTVSITQIAADYGMSAVAMNRLLNKLGVQHKISGQWILYKKHMKNGYTKSHTSEIKRSSGGTKVVMNTKWTQKGRLFLYNLLKENGYSPQMDLDLNI